MTFSCKKSLRQFLMDWGAIHASHSTFELLLDSATSERLVLMDLIPLIQGPYHLQILQPLLDPSWKGPQKSHGLSSRLQDLTLIRPGVLVHPQTRGNRIMPPDFLTLSVPIFYPYESKHDFKWNLTFLFTYRNFEEHTLTFSFALRCH